MKTKTILSALLLVIMIYKAEAQNSPPPTVNRDKCDVIQKYACVI